MTDIYLTISLIVNKLCLDRCIIPNYVHKTVCALSPAACFTNIKTQQFMIKASLPLYICLCINIYRLMADLDSRSVLQSKIND